MSIPVRYARGTRCEGESERLIFLRESLVGAVGIEPTPHIWRASNNSKSTQKILERQSPDLTVPRKASVATYARIWIRKLTYSACNSRKGFLAAIRKSLCLGQWFLRYSSCFFSPQEAQTTSKELFAPTLKRFELKIDLCEVRKITARGHCGELGRRSCVPARFESLSADR
jgi:hypothetical protein